MLKETEETIVFCDIFIIGSISIGEVGGPTAPLAMPMALDHHSNSTGQTLKNVKIKTPKF